MCDRPEKSWGASFHAAVTGKTAMSAIEYASPPQPAALRQALLEQESNVQISDTQGIFLNELPARFDDVAHQARENFIGDVGLFDLDLQQ